MAGLACRGQHNNGSSLALVGGKDSRDGGGAGGVDGNTFGLRPHHVFKDPLVPAAEMAVVLVESMATPLDSALIMSSKILSFQQQASASLLILAIVFTQMTGKSPLAVSPESIVQSDP